MYPPNVKIFHRAVNSDNLPSIVAQVVEKVNTFYGFYDKNKHFDIKFANLWQFSVDVFGRAGLANPNPSAQGVYQIGSFGHLFTSVAADNAKAFYLDLKADIITFGQIFRYWPYPLRCFAHGTAG